MFSFTMSGMMKAEDPSNEIFKLDGSVSNASQDVSSLCISDAVGNHISSTPKSARQSTRLRYFFHYNELIIEKRNINH